MTEKHGSHWLEREDLGDITLVRLKTPKFLDDDIVRDVFDPIYTLSGIGRNLLVLNVAGAEYLPSLGLGKLVMLNRKVQAANGRLALCHLSTALREILDNTHLSDLLAVYPTEQAALQSFS
jgi:anti-anti-sigma factor